MRLLIFTLALTFTLPTFARTLKQELALSGQLIFSNLDSAVTLLTHLEQNQAKLQKQERGELASNWGVFYALTGQNKMALHYFWKAYALAPKGADSRISMLQNIANVHRALAEYEVANTYLKRAYLNHKRKGKHKEKFVALGEMASNHYFMMHWEQAIKLNLKAIAGFKRLGEERFLAIQQQRLANIYFSLEKYDKALPLYLSSMKYYAQNASEKLNAGYVRIALGDLYFKTKDYQEAIRYYAGAIHLLKQTDITKYWLAKCHLAMALLEQGYTKSGFESLLLAYKELKNFGTSNLDEPLNYLLEYSTDKPQYAAFLEQEIAYLKKQRSMGVHFNMSTWQGFTAASARFYERNNNLKMALYTQKILRNLDKELNIDLTKEKSERLLEKKAFENELLETKYLKAKIVRYRLVQGIWILSIVLLIFVSVTLYLINKSKIKNQALQNLRLKLENSDLVAQLELEHENLRLEQELKQAKERELAALSLQFYQFNENLIQEMEALQAKSSTVDINVLQKKLSAAHSKNDYWKEFKLKFTQLNPNFFTHLQEKFPQLSIKELDFCALIRLNLSNKEIASLTQISYESVISKKYKLRKKLHIETEAELLSILTQL